MIRKCSFILQFKTLKRLCCLWSLRSPRLCNRYQYHSVCIQACVCVHACAFVHLWKILKTENKVWILTKFEEYSSMQQIYRIICNVHVLPLSIHFFFVLSLFLYSKVCMKKTSASLACSIFSLFKSCWESCVVCLWTSCSSMYLYLYTLMYTNNKPQL